MSPETGGSSFLFAAAHAELKRTTVREAFDLAFDTESEDAVMRATATRQFSKSAGMRWHS